MRNNFRIIQTIYQSRRTEVFRAVRESDGLPMVLKTRPGSIVNEIEAGLLREFDLGKTLEGRRSVKHLALERDGGMSILVPRDDDMNALESEIPEKGLDLPRFLNLAVEIASAIEEIHAQGVIHKDINGQVLTDMAPEFRDLIGPKPHQPEDILHFPVTDDPLNLARMEVLAAASPTACIGYPEHMGSGFKGSELKDIENYRSRSLQ